MVRVLLFILKAQKGIESYEGENIITPSYYFKNASAAFCEELAQEPEKERESINV